MQLLYSAPAPYVRAAHLNIAIFWVEQSSGMNANTAKHVKKEQRQVNKKFRELKGGVVEKAQETRFGMSPKYSR